MLANKSGIPQLFDIVELVVDLPEERIRRGSVGAVAMAFDQPEPTFDADFFDEDGHPRAVRRLTREHLRVISRQRW